MKRKRIVVKNDKEVLFNVYKSFYKLQNSSNELFVIEITVLFTHQPTKVKLKSRFVGSKSNLKKRTVRNNVSEKKKH